MTRTITVTDEQYVLLRSIVNGVGRLQARRLADPFSDPKQEIATAEQLASLIEVVRDAVGEGQ